jgi:F0F1-type ATP synthase membrane subunit b/b'
MPKPMIRIYTTADEYIDREMTAAEYKVYQADQAEAEARKAEAEAKAAAKQAILDRIGLTADELQTILG